MFIITLLVGLIKIKYYKLKVDILNFYEKGE